MSCLFSEISTIVCKSDRKGFVKTFIGQAREDGRGSFGKKRRKNSRDSGVELCKIYSREIVPRE